MKSLAITAWILAAISFGGFSSHDSTVSSEIIIGVPDQTLAIVDGQRLIARYPVSTLKFGLDDSSGSYRTPLDILFVSGKCGDHLAAGAVIKNRVPTGSFEGKLFRT
jgi:hypothetical protein